MLIKIKCYYTLLIRAVTLCEMFLMCEVDTVTIAAFIIGVYR